MGHNRAVEDETLTVTDPTSGGVASDEMDLEGLGEVTIYVTNGTDGSVNVQPRAVDGDRGEFDIANTGITSLASDNRDYDHWTEHHPTIQFFVDGDGAGRTGDVTIRVVGRDN